MPDIDSLNIQITASAKSAQDSIDRLSGALGNLKKNLGGISLGDLTKLKDDVAALSQSSSNISATATHIKSLSEALKGMSSKGLTSFSKVISGIGNALNEIDASAISKLNDIADAMERLSRAAKDMPSNILVLKALAGAFGGGQGVQTPKVKPTEEPQGPKESAQTPTQEVSEVGEEAEQAERRVLSLKEALASIGVDFHPLKTVVSGLKAIGSALGKIYVGAAKAFAWPFMKVAQGVKGLVGKIGQLGAAFKRIMFYRAVRTIIKMITQSVKEGVNNLYEYSKLTGGEFAQAMNRASTATHYFKNSLGAMLGPIITNLIPVLELVIDKVVEFMNAINQLIAKLSGASTWTRALRYPYEYGQAADNAAGKVKKLKDYMLGIDELNVFNDDNGSGSGAGGSGVDASQLFEEVPEFDNGIADFAERIREAIKNGDWEGVGKLLGEKVNSVIDHIKTSEIGKKIGTVINNAIRLVSGFFSEADFRGLGAALGTQINSLVQQIEPGSIGRTIASVITSAAALVGGFFSETDFEEIGSRIGINLSLAMESIKRSELGRDIASVVNGAIGFVSGMLNTTDFKGIASAVTTQIAQFLGNTDWHELGKDITGLATGLATFIGGLFSNPDLFANVASSISGIFSGALSQLASWFEETDAKQLASDIMDAIGSFLENIDWAGLAEKLFEVIKGAFKFLLEFVTGIVQPIIDWAKQVLGDTPSYSEFVERQNRIAEDMGRTRWTDEQLRQAYRERYGSSIETGHSTSHAHSSGMTFSGHGGSIDAGSSAGASYAENFMSRVANWPSTKFSQWLEKLRKQSQTYGTDSGSKYAKNFGSGAGGASNDMNKHLYSAFRGMRLSAQSYGKSTGEEYGKAFKNPFSAMFSLTGTVSTIFTKAVRNWANASRTSASDSVGYWTKDAKTSLEKSYGENNGTITNVISNAFKKFKGFAQTAADQMSGSMSGFEKTIKTMMDGDNSTIARYASSGSSGIQKVFASLPTWFQNNVVGSVSEKFKYLFTGDKTGNPLEQGARTGVGKIQGAFSGIAEWFQTNVTGKVSGAFNALFKNSGSGSVDDSSKSGVSKIKDAFKMLPPWFKGDLKTDLGASLAQLFGDGSTEGIVEKRSRYGVKSMKLDWSQFPKWFKDNVADKIGKDLDDTFTRRYVIGTTSTGNNISGWNINRVDTKASGGFLSSGQLFLARENGINEMIGSVGSRNAVANNYQIEEGIARATARANERTIIALYTIAGQLVQAIEDNAVDFLIGDDQIGQANQRYQQKSGVNTSKGAFANAY